MSIDRRHFLQLSTAAAIATSCTGELFASALSPQNVPIIDTHQHLWDLVQYQPPWLKEADAKIAAKHDMRDYVQETNGLNVVKAIYMEVDVDPADQVKEAEYVLGLIASGKTPTVAAVISGRPGSSQFAEYIKRFRDNALIKGVRQVLHAGSAERGLCLQPQFVKSVQLLGEMGKSFDLCMRPSELSDGASLAEKCPGTLFIVDHLGNADPAAWLSKEKQVSAPKHTVEQWSNDMRRFAKLPNVICKISGIVAQAKPGWKADLLAPPINFCLDTFGPDRVVFGGDWPVCKLGASYAEWVSALKQIVAQRSAEEQRKLFHDNAVRHYKLA